MPVRIRKDSNASSPQKRIPGQGGGMGSGGGGGGIGTALLPLLFSLFRKYPKMAILLIGAGIVGYFLISRSNGPASSAVQNLIFGTGLEMDEQIYDQAEVFEPLADNIKNPLPESISLEAYCPPRLNQGSQGSCVGWSSAYAARTILQARSSGEDPENVSFSPSFVYNQIALPGCQGTYLQKAMEVMHTSGALPFSKFAYDENSCSHKPSRFEISSASSYKTKGFNRLTRGGDDYQTDMLAIKQNLAQGAPVVIGMMVGGSFMSDMTGRRIWSPDRSDYSMRGFGGHALCVIGYDDYYEGGAFQVMNSWGEEWGEDGLFWIRYNDFEYFTREAYGLYPMGNAEEISSELLEVEIGLILNSTGGYIPFKQVDGTTFTTVNPVEPDKDFKVEITNSLECYTYIFGKETDGTSYVLFPYTRKHSPYCGVKGTRLFPKDYSLYPDNQGDTDYIAVIISRQKLDYNLLNDAINQAPGTTFDQKVVGALQGELVENLEFEDGKTIKFSSSNTRKNTIALVMALNK